MAGQGLLFRASNFVSSCRFLLNNRVQINVQPQTLGLKARATKKLQELNVPEKPKKPLTAFLKFSQSQRPSIIKDHPDWRLPEISKDCAERWRSIDPTTKQKYEEEYKTELATYATKILDFKSKLTDEQTEALKNVGEAVKKDRERRAMTKKFRENSRPKRPMGAYSLFVMDHCKRNPEKSYAVLLKDLKGPWADLPEAEKDKYLDDVRQARLKHEEELLEWERKMLREGNEELVRVKTRMDKRPASSRGVKRE